jgi:hypothetical protein
MPICAPGTSQQKPGVGPIIAIGASTIAAMLNNIPTIWAVPLAGFLGFITYDLSTMCSEDPPALPTITSDDALALLNPYEPLPYIAALDKFRQLVQVYAWYEFCECVGATTPAPPTPPSAPSGWPTFDPPSIPRPINTYCWDSSATFYRNELPSFTDPNTGHPLYEVTSRLLPTIGGSFVEVTGGPARPSYLIPPDTVAYTVDITSNADVYGGYQPLFNVKPRDIAGNIVGGTSEDAGPLGTTWTRRHVLPSTAQQIYISYHGELGSTNANLTFRIRFECASGATIEQPCCPPDATLEGILQTILANVTLIQRQSVPFAYIRSTVHTGLSGDGHITVQGLIGCLVQLTTTPANVGVELADPLVYWEAGWINWGNADGSSPRQRITASPQLSLPGAAGQYTRIGYSLPVGVVATITELVREP